MQLDDLVSGASAILGREMASASMNWSDCGWEMHRMRDFQSGGMPCTSDVQSFLPFKLYLESVFLRSPLKAT